MLTAWDGETNRRDRSESRYVSVHQNSKGGKKLENKKKIRKIRTENRRRDVVILFSMKISEALPACTCMFLKIFRPRRKYKMEDSYVGNNNRYIGGRVYEWEGGGRGWWCFSCFVDGNIVSTQNVQIGDCLAVWRSSPQAISSTPYPSHPLKRGKRILYMRENLIEGKKNWRQRISDIKKREKSWHAHKILSYERYL